MFESYIAQAGAVAMALACIFGVIRGRWPEQVASVTLAANWVGCAALEDRRYIHHPFHHLDVQPGIATIDVLYAGLLLILVLASRRRWLIYAFGLQALLVAIHAATFLDARVSHFDFFSAYFVVSWGILVALAVGTAIEGRRPAFRRDPYS